MVEVVTRFSSDSALTGRSSTLTPSSLPAFARSPARSVLTVTGLTAHFQTRARLRRANQQFSEQYHESHPNNAMPDFWIAGVRDAR